MKKFFLLLLVIIPYLLNASTEDKIEELKKRIEAEKREIEVLTDKEKILSLSISEIKKRLSDIKEKIKSVENNKKIIQAELKKLQIETETLKEKLNVKLGEVENRLVIWHRTNLFAQKGPAFDLKESLLFEGYMRHLFNYDRQLITALRENKTSLENNLAVIQKKKNELELTEESLKQKRKIEETLEKREAELLKKTKKEKDIHIKNLRKAEASLRQLEALLKKVEEIPQYEGKGLAKKVLPYPVKGEIVGHFGIEEGIVKGSKFTRKGVEIKAFDGASVRAIDNGRIVHTGWIKALGNICIISHGDGYYSVYGRLKDLTRKKGEDIKQGEVIGYVGADSMFYEFPTLYFEIRKKDVPINPELMLR